MPRQHVIEEDIQCIEARVGKIQKDYNLNDLEHTKQFRKEVDRIHERAHAEALKKAQEQWLNDLEKKKKAQKKAKK